MGKYMLKNLQNAHAIWQHHNFPNAEKWECLVGAMEELGELSHAHLKMKQGIRLNEDHSAAQKDAVGDVVIYLLGYCLDIDECIESAWSEVSKRDWTIDD
jgi:NTP pyrophosphatase (non-canonical NTP hydrolase)